jgi:hypothetical protein
MDDLLERLGALPKEADPGTDGWPAIEDHIRGAHRERRWVKAAAAIVIFAAGATGGFFARGGAPAPDAGSIDEALLLAVEVQRTGSEYVAALSAFADVVDDLSVDVRAQGRDAAIATLFGAATELAALDGGTDGLLIPRNRLDANRVRF